MKTCDYDFLPPELSTPEEQYAEITRNRRSSRTLAPTKIPMPPYDRALPSAYWESLKTGQAQTPAQRVRQPLPWGKIWLVIKTITLALVVIIPIVLLFVWPQPSPFPRARTDAEVAAQVQAEQALAPRAALVRLPPPSVPPARHWMIEGGKEEAIPGRQYWARMPDGRRILVNFKGNVPDVGAIPPQPDGGANNAAYFDQQTGNTWIWTVPVGASNVPEWIDP